MATTHVFIDFETRGQRDLLSTGGTARYARDALTDINCVSYAFDDGPIQTWWRGQPVPPAIIAAATDPDYVFVAHNAFFERSLLQHVLTPRYGWPEIPIARWRCTQAAGLYLALPARLEQIAAALSLPQLKANTAIVGLMADPIDNPDPTAPPRWHEEPELRQQLEAYNRQDVEVLRALFNWLPPLPSSEQQIWEFDQVVNDRGFYCDGVSIKAAIAIYQVAHPAAQTGIQHLTDGEVETTEQKPRLLAWLAARCCKLPNCKRSTITRALQRTDLSLEVREALEFRLEASFTSAGKYQTLQNRRCLDGRVRGDLRYGGAGTLRWAGFGSQPQNFKKEVEDIVAKYDAVMSGDVGRVRQFGPPIGVLSEILRSVICAPPGSRLLDGDFSGIESRVLAWLAGQSDKLELWARFDRTQLTELDPYFILGRQLGFPEATARKYGKVADLAFGYAGRIPAFRNFAKDTPLAELADAEIMTLRQAWLAKHRQIAQFWDRLNRVAIAAIKRAPQPIDCGRLTAHCEQLHGVPFLFITLPSGHTISYPFAAVIQNKNGFPTIGFMDNAPTTGGWTPYKKGYGTGQGTLVENATQGVARDLLAAAMLRLEAAGYPVVLHVHDQIVSELPVGVGDPDEFRRLIEQLPGWVT